MSRSQSVRVALGTAALAIGGAGVAMGILGVTWKVVIPTGAVALLLGLMAIGGSRTAAASLLSWAGTLAGITALIIGVWGSAVFLRGSAEKAQQQAHLNTPSAAAETTAAQGLPSINGPVNAFGTSMTVDGLTITVSQPHDYTTQGVAGAADGSPIVRAVKFTVTIDNNSSATLNAVGISVQGLAGNQVAQRVYDTVVIAPPNNVLPGSSISFPAALSVSAAPGPLTVIVQPNSQNSADQVYFAGTV